MTSPDIVIGYHKLDTKFFTGHVQHTTFHSDASQGRRRVKEVENWYRDREIGRGAFGTVFLERSEGGECRAVKEIAKGSSINIDYRRELMAMAVLAKHDALFVQLFGWYENDNYVHIAMEYISHGHLRKYLEVERSESEAKVITRQLLEGLAVIHQEGFAHRDLKPENILVVSPSPVWVKIGDFGLAKLARGGTAFRTQVFSRDYVAPEMVVDTSGETSEYTNAVDIWAIGCIAHEMLTRVPPFRNLAKLCSYFNRPEFPRGPMLLKNISEKGMEIVESMLALLPERRITAKEALDSEWLRLEDEWREGLEREVVSTDPALPEVPAPSGGSAGDKRMQKYNHLPQQGSIQEFPNARLDQFMLKTTQDRDAGLTQPPASYPPAGLGLGRYGPADDGTFPQINVIFSPPQRQPTFPSKPGFTHDGSALSPPPKSPRLKRSKSDHFSGSPSGGSPITRPIAVPGSQTPKGGRSRGNSLSPMDVVTAPVGSPGSNASSNAGKISRRSSTNSLPNKDYFLCLGRPGNSASGKRVQERPATFQCTLCPESFSSLYNLRSHLRTYTDGRPFVCTICGKGFAQQHDRWRHEGMHSREGIVCRGSLYAGGTWGCGRRFTRVDFLCRHFCREGGWLCIRPLLEEEEMAERQPSQMLAQRQMLGPTMGQLSSNSDAPGMPLGSKMDPVHSGMVAPSLLLEQYPELANMEWGSLSLNANELRYGGNSGNIDPAQPTWTPPTHF